jgi:hypothetical protein
MNRGGVVGGSERVFCRLLQKDACGYRHAFGPVLAGDESINRLARKYELKKYFDDAGVAPADWRYSAFKVVVNTESSPPEGFLSR